MVILFIGLGGIFRLVGCGLIVIIFILCMWCLVVISSLVLVGRVIR